MPKYCFDGMDSSGSVVTDQIAAANEADAQRQLRARGYFVTRLREVSGKPVQYEPPAEERKALSPAASSTVGRRRQPWLRLDLDRWKWPVVFLAFLVFGAYGLWVSAVRPLWQIR